MERSYWLPRGRYRGVPEYSFLTTERNQNDKKLFRDFVIFYIGITEEGRGVHNVLFGKPEGKRPLRRPRRRWENNIKMDVQEVGRGCVDWMELS